MQRFGVVLSKQATLVVPGSLGSYTKDLKTSHAQYFSLYPYVNWSSTSDASKHLSGHLLKPQGIVDKLEQRLLRLQNCAALSSNTLTMQKVNGRKGNCASLTMLHWSHNRWNMRQKSIKPHHCSTKETESMECRLLCNGKVSGLFWPFSLFFKSILFKRTPTSMNVSQS